MTENFTLSSTANALESRIRANRLLDLDVAWQNEFVYPYYDGLSIFNVVQSVLHLLGAEASVPLDPAVWGSESPIGEVDRVVIFLTDGLGYLLLNEFMQDDVDLHEIVADLTDGRGPVPLTSTAPSTTAVALPTLWSAAQPAQHGMLGTVMYLPQFMSVSNMLTYSPLVGNLKPGIFADWGAAPETFVPTPMLAQRLSHVDVPTHLLLDKALTGTGLSRILHRGVGNLHRHGGSVDTWLRLQDVLTETAGQRCYINAYWPVVDMLSHMYGAKSKYVHNEIKHQLSALRDVLNQESVQDGRTLFIIMADHGHYDSTEILYSEKNPLPEPIQSAIRAVTGDIRFAQLFLNSAMAQDVKAYLQEYLCEQVAFVEPQNAVDAGLFGATDQLHEQLLSRMGDLIVMSRIGYRFYDPRPTKPISIHGGLSDSEMLVPFLWKRI